jgi:polyhydroxyalkanoate synthase
MITKTPTKHASARATHGATKTAADLGDLVAQASENTLAINPLTGLQLRDVVSGARSLLKVMTTAPGRTALHYGRYLKELTTVVAGKSDLAPEPKDRRFADPAWQGNALYTRLMQTYLATQKGLAGVIDGAPLGCADKGRAQFFASLVTDALAPSNFVLGNPAAVRKLLDTGGDNLVKGLQNLLHDARYNHLMPSQVDTTPFKVGENVATTAGQVVHRDEMFELLQYTPTTPQVHARPLVMSPPQVNKYYAVDLAPEKSLITQESKI